MYKIVIENVTIDVTFLSVYLTHSCKITKIKPTEFVADYYYTVGL